MKRLMLGLMLAFAATAEADFAPIGDLMYDLDTEAKTATLIAHNPFGNPPTTVDVSEVEWEEQKYTVTSVGENAFGWCDSLTYISLPNATTIGDFAFQGCGSLKEISLPKVTTIEFGVFEDCGSLSSVCLPNATTIGERVFDGCSSLTSVSLPNAITVDQYAFSGCSSLASVSLPLATTIEQSAFYQCGSLTSVSLPKIETIEEGLFRGFEKLTSVSLPNATTIGAEAFKGCSSLTSVSLPNAITVDQYAFQGCSSLTSVLLPKVTTIHGRAFSETSLSVLFVNADTKSVIETDRGYYGIPDSSTIIAEALSEDVVKNAEYVVQEPVVETNVQLTVSSEVKVLPSVTMKSGDTVLNEAIYEASCAYYGCTPLTKPETPEVPAEPTADDFKVVSKDAQVIGSDEIAVKKESIAAPSAGTVKVEDNKVQLGVTVLKTSDLTAETKKWDKVKITKDNIDVDADGNIIINVPVDSASGFMILQSGDAKVQSNELKLSGGKVFTGDY